MPTVVPREAMVMADGGGDVAASSDDGGDTGYTVRKNRVRSVMQGSKRSGV